MYELTIIFYADLINKHGRPAKGWFRTTEIKRRISCEDLEEVFRTIDEADKEFEILEAKFRVVHRECKEYKECEQKEYYEEDEC